MAKIFVCIGQNVWGKGFTERQAVDAAKLEGGASSVKKRLIYLTTDPDVYVDGPGSIVYKPALGLKMVAKIDGRKHLPVDPPQFPLPE